MRCRRGVPGQTHICGNSDADSSVTTMPVRQKGKYNVFLGELSVFISTSVVNPPTQLRYYIEYISLNASESALIYPVN